MRGSTPGQGAFLMSLGLLRPKSISASTGRSRAAYHSPNPYFAALTAASSRVVRAASVAAAASYLGRSQSDPHTQLQAGKALAEVANAEGKPVPKLENAMAAASRATSIPTAG